MSRIAWVRRVCALVVALVAAYSSFEHQCRFALDGGADPLGALLWPLSVDGLVVLASLGLFNLGPSASRRTRWSVWGAFGAGVVISLVANVAAAPELTWRPVIVAGWPPVALLLAVELLMPRSDAMPSISTVSNSAGTAVSASRPTGPRRAETAAATHRAVLRRGPDQGTAEQAM